MSGHSLASIGRARSLARLLGAVAGMVMGVLYGTLIVAHSGGRLAGNLAIAMAAVLAAGVATAAVLGLAMPRLTVDPYLWLRDVLERAPAAEIAGAVAGLLIALLVSALVAVLLAGLPWGAGMLISVSLACALVHAGVTVGRRRGDAFAALVSGLRWGAGAPAEAEQATAAAIVDAPAPAADGPPIVVDTSALIDGRLAAVARSGFLQGSLLIPAFVLTELQKVADSSSTLRRARGRRGLELVARLREGREVRCEVVEARLPEGADVDASLVSLARERDAALLTTDHNLDRVARLTGVRVLNLNELADAVRPVVAAGDRLEVNVIRGGREAGQGVGYLDDGTMVVVENGLGSIGASLAVTVSSVLQTPSGRMVFAARADRDRRSLPGSARGAPEAAQR